MRGIFSARTGGGLAALATAATVATVLPATAHAAEASAFRYPTATVQFASKTVPAPGAARAVIRASACVSHVSAYAVNLRTGVIISSLIAGGSGRTFTVVFPVRAVAPGTYEIGGVFGRPCTAKSGEEQLDPAHGHFAAAFDVTARQ
jgi:hypothetical protein